LLPTADYQFLDEQAVKLCTEVGLATTNYNNIGVYHYRVADGPADMNTCSIIVNPGSKVKLLSKYFLGHLYARD